MKKLLLLFITLISFSGYTTAQDNHNAPVTADGQVMTFTTNKTEGCRVQLTITSDGGFTIEGVEEKATEGYSGYTLKGQEVKIYGKVKEFSAPYCDITDIDIKGMPTLKTLDVFGNPITSLDLSESKMMNYLVVGATNLTSLDLSLCPSLENLNINSCKIESLDLSGSENMVMILAKQAGLKNLNLNGAKRLDILDCSYNKLGKIDLSAVPTLTQLSCAGNELDELDLSNVNLLVLNCNVNNLKTLDLSGQTDLEEFGCINNQLTTLDLTACESLFGAMICGNQIFNEEMTKLCLSMPEVSGASGYFTVVDLTTNTERNECSVANVELMKAKNWDVLNYEGGMSGYDYGSPYDGMPEEQLGINDTEMTDFTVHTSVNDSKVYVAGVKAGTAIRIIDLQGKVMMTQNAAADVTVLDTGAMQKGVYFVAVGSQSVKFVVR